MSACERDEVALTEVACVVRAAISRARWVRNAQSVDLPPPTHPTANQRYSVLVPVSHWATTGILVYVGQDPNKRHLSRQFMEDLMEEANYRCENPFDNCPLW